MLWSTPVGAGKKATLKFPADTYHLTRVGRLAVDYDRRVLTRVLFSATQGHVPHVQL